MKNILVLLISILVFNSCSDNDGFFDPTYLGDGFKGIAFTLEDQPIVIGGDRSDWCYSFDLHKENYEVPFPTKFALYPAYPNPSVYGKPVNLIFSLPEIADAYLYIIDKENRIIKVLVNETFQAGNYMIEVDTRAIGAGVYRVVFEANDFYCAGDIWIKKK